MESIILVTISSIEGSCAEVMDEFNVTVSSSTVIPFSSSFKKLRINEPAVHAQEPFSIV